ncbi:unnamed protein product [Trichobilharzia regenti]|nr:unnamed protein product [Trichobilharzia regenti]
MPLRSNKVSKFCSKQKFNNTINTDKNEYKSQLKSTPDLRSAINSQMNNNTTTTTSGANNGQRLSRPTPPPVPLSLQTPEIKMNTSQPTSVMGNDELGIWIEKPIVSVKAEDKTILNQLMNCNLKSIHNCSICNKPMSVNERYDLVDQVVHRNCFKCSVCSQTLT